MLTTLNGTVRSLEWTYGAFAQITPRRIRDLAGQAPVTVRPLSTGGNRVSDDEGIYEFPYGPSHELTVAYMNRHSEVIVRVKQR